MLTNSIINAKRSTTYSQYQAPPNYIWATGDSFNGQLDSDITSLEPRQIGALTDWSLLYANSVASYGIKTDGTLWSWGDNGNGQLGLNISTGEVRSSPVQVGTLTNWQSLGVNGSQATHQLAIKTDGTLWGWGNGASGALGDGTVTVKSSPIQIGTLTNWSQVAIGGSFSMAIKTDGTLWAWGYNANGLFGDDLLTY